MGTGAVGLVLHPRRDTTVPVTEVLEWAQRRNKPVLALLDDQPERLPGGIEAVDAAELTRRSSLIVSLGGDGTMLRALRLARAHGVPVLGVNLGRLGFLAEVDVPELEAALVAIEMGQHVVERRLALIGRVGGVDRVAFNDFVLVRRPGTGSAAIAVHVDGEPFVRYAADAVVVSTPTGSTAYSFSAGGPIVSPRAEGQLVIPVAPHSAFNRALFLSCDEPLALEVLASSGAIAVEVDGRVVGDLVPGDWLHVGVDQNAGSVVRLGQRSFYARARRKLHLSDSAELA
jgi:NAD+ kinase